MVYQNKLVAALKVDGKVLRETGDSVAIPFGSEYSILIKNLNSVRVQVKVSVDGKDATDGTWLIVQPNSSVELERFISNGNWSSGNRFKFIERTADIENHRGIKEDDGLIRIEYKTERVRQVNKIVVDEYHYNHHYDWWWGPYYRLYPYRFDNPYYGTWPNSGSVNCNTTTSGSLPRATRSSSPVRVMAMNCSANLQKSIENVQNDAGITVPGSISNQTFQSGAWFDTHPQSEVVVLRLKGEVKGKKVSKPVTVKSKSTCATCGKKNKAGIEFCPKCGTAVTIV